MEPTTLAGRYALTERIGTGGMGVVWRARDAMLSRDVAVKILHDHLASDATFAERFRREARSAARLSQPNVVTVYDSGEHDHRPFIVMELIEGESLDARLRREQRIPAPEAVRITGAVLRALAHAHERGLVHRDMKPANVLLTPGGEVKVADFGIAKGPADAGLTSTGMLVGTAAYLSPEQVLGRPATPASDLYAVGCLLYACLEGHPPFTADAPVAVALRHTRDPVPPMRAGGADQNLVAVVMRALAKDPGDRFASAPEMHSALEGGGTPVATDPVTPPDQHTTASMGTQQVTTPAPEATTVLRRPERPRRGARTAGMLAAAIFVAAVVWLLASFVAEPDQVVDAPVPTTAPQTEAVPTPTPDESPDESPEPTPEGDEGPPSTPPPAIDLPGIRIP